MLFLDTTVLIDILKGDLAATETVRKFSSSSGLFTSTVNIYEIMKGVYSIKGNRKKYFDAVDSIIANVNVLPLSRSASMEAAKQYAGLKSRGESIGEPDCLIAGICLSNKIRRIMTRNRRHFEKVRELEIIGY